jgi:hypothetical protein
MERTEIGRVLRDARFNAALAWLLVVAVLLAGAGSLARGELLGALFAVVVALLAALPALALRSPDVMLPWEVVLFAVLPLVGRLFAQTVVSGQITEYFAVAMLALVVAVELHVFTPVRMNDSFAVLFVVVTTMAAAGVWAVVRWFSDLYANTTFIESEHALLVEFVASTAAGLLAGVVFVVYFRRWAAPQRRVPEEADLP